MSKQLGSGGLAVLVRVGCGVCGFSSVDSGALVRWVFDGLDRLAGGPLHLMLRYFPLLLYLDQSLEAAFQGSPVTVMELRGRPRW